MSDGEGAEGARETTAKSEATGALPESTQASPGVADETAGAGESKVLEPDRCRIVAIGASAGGLDPFEKFFDNVTPDTGMAFVIIQHLSPDFKSMMDELLSRHSDMRIKRVVDGMRIEPNTIYLNPPRTEMCLERGRFSLKQVDADLALHLPINTFLCSLAKERKTDSIAIILSGTGSDGTIGAEAVQGAGGTVLVQDPKTAKFDGMPSSVISKIHVDAVAPPEQLGAFVCRIASGEEIAVPAPSITNVEPKELVFQVLRDRFGTDFAHYKDATIERRLKRRAELLTNGDLGRYARLLEDKDEEVESLYADFLIEVTEFFRDRGAFSALETTVVPKLVQKMGHDSQVRIWVPGCASGEEAYSIAIAMHEECRKQGVTAINMKILATDIHSRSLDAANAGIYTEKALQSIGPELRDRYFERSGSRYQIRSFIRQMIVFSTHNILRDPPFTKIDLVSCRNLLIYLNEVAQQKALAFFHFSLLKDGFLFLGPSETVGALSNEFDCIDQRWRLFRKRRNVRLIESMTKLPPGVDLPRTVSSGHEMGLIRGDARRVSDRTLDLLLKKYAPPGFLITRSGDLIRIFGDAGRFIDVGEGNFSKRLDDLVRGDLRVVIAAALDRAKSNQALPFERRVRVREDDGGSVSLIVTLLNISSDSRDNNYLLLTIEEEARKQQPVSAEVSQRSVVEAEEAETSTLLRQTIQDLEHELQSTEETLQTTIEELETSNEELQATNEELIASNEELQSTNEELHSVNEELYTVSAEHQRKIAELTEMTDDMEHLLMATDIGTIFVDYEMLVRRFTPASKLAFNILEQDLGRPLTHITNGLNDPDFPMMVRGVIDTGDVEERSYKIGERYVMLRVLPYRPSPSTISGAVITTIDITELKASQKLTEQLANRYEGIVDDLSEFIFRWNKSDRKISFCNSPFLKNFDLDSKEVLERDVSAVIPRAQQSSFFKAVDALEPRQVKRFLFQDGTSQDRMAWYECIVRAIGDSAGNVVEFQAVGKDVTTETAYRVALEKLSRVRDDYGAPFESIVAELLKIGSDFFGMPLGIFSEITEDEYRIRSVVGGDRFGVSQGDVLPLRKTFCADLGGTVEPLAIDHVSECDYKDHEAHISTGIESYIGRKIIIGSEERGALSFSSRGARLRPFEDLEYDFIGILAEWIGRRAERHLALEALHRAKADLQLVIDSVRAKIWYKDDKNRIIRLNRPAAAAMGVTVEEGTGADTYELFPEMAAKYHQDDLKVIETGEPMLDILEQFTPLNGPHAWVKTDKIPYTDPDTGDRRILVIAMDVTAFKMQEARVHELNSELSEANERLMQSNQGLKQFAHVASHDLQEPLRKLIQFTEYLVDDCGDALSEDGQYFVNVIAGSAQRMRQLINDLLALSSASGSELQIERHDMTDVFEEVRHELDLSIRDTGAEVIVGSLSAVMGDATLLGQLARNLLSNALKYRREGVAPVVRITEALGDDGTRYVSVSDNGIGIDPEHFERVFDPFARLHDRKRFDGTGIGLTICKTVCERHGWFMSVESTPGEGSTFIVGIPSSALVQWRWQRSPPSRC